MYTDRPFYMHFHDRKSYGYIRIFYGYLRIDAFAMVLTLQLVGKVQSHYYARVPADRSFISIRDIRNE